MSRYIPHTVRAPQTRWVYLANPKTGEVVRVRKHNLMEIYSLQDKGYGITTRSIYQRAFGNKYKPFGISPSSFAVSEFPTNSRRFIPANIYMS